MPLLKRKLYRFFCWILTLIGAKKINFIHVGKTGGTAIRNAFAESRKITGNYYFGLRHIFVMHGHNFKLSDCGPSEYVFFTVRDPLSRFVSSFYSRFREGKPKNYNPWTDAEKQSFEIFKTPNELAEALSSSDMSIKKAAEYAMLNIGHVKSSYWEWFVSEEYLLLSSNSKCDKLVENQTNFFSRMQKVQV